MTCEIWDKTILNGINKLCMVMYTFMKAKIVNFQVSAIIVSRPSSNISENNDAHLGVNLVLDADKIAD